MMSGRWDRRWRHHGGTVLAAALCAMLAAGFGLCLGSERQRPEEAASLSQAQFDEIRGIALRRHVDPAYNRNIAEVAGLNGILTHSEPRWIVVSREFAMENCLRCSEAVSGLQQLAAIGHDGFERVRRKLFVGDFIPGRRNLEFKRRCWRSLRGAEPEALRRELAVIREELLAKGRVRAPEAGAARFFELRGFVGGLDSNSQVAIRETKEPQKLRFSFVTSVRFSPKPFVLLVDYVHPGSSAEKGGLRAGDIIESANGESARVSGSSYGREDL